MGVGVNQPIEEPHLITVATTAWEVDKLLDGVRLTLYGRNPEWSAVVWLDDNTYGVGKGNSWYLAADRALRNARGKVGR